MGKGTEISYDYVPSMWRMCAAVVLFGAAVFAFRKGYIFPRTRMTDQQALEVIELICADDFCVNLDMRADAEPDKEWALSPDLKTAHEKLSKVYCIAHSLVTSHSCYSVHDDWRKEAEEAVAQMEAEKVKCR